MPKPAGLFFGSYAPEAKEIVVRSQREARLRSRRQILAVDMLVVIAAYSPLLIASAYRDTRLTAARLRETSPITGGVDPIPEPGHIPMAGDLKSALSLTAGLFASRGTANARVTPVHLLAGLVAAPDSTAIRTLAAARANIDVARRRIALMLDSVHGPVRTFPAGPTGRWARRARRGAQDVIPHEPSRSADDHASVVAYAEYQRSFRVANELMNEGQFGESAELWQQLARLHPAEPAVLFSLGWCLTVLGRWDEGAVRLREAMAVTQRDDGWGAEARNCFAWESVTQELFASGTVDPATLGTGRQAAEDAVAYWPIPNYVDTLALIHVLQGNPGKAADLLSPFVTRASDGVAHWTEDAHVGTKELTCALAYRALGDTSAALRLLASAREPKIPAPLAQYESRYLEWAAEAIRNGRIPGNPPSRPT